MKIMVTGGAGFIGSHLVNSLQNDGHELMVLDNLATGTPSNFDSRLLEYGDVTELTELGINFKPEVIIHLAGEFRPKLIKYDQVKVANTNIKGTAEVMKFAVMRGVRRVVNISSAAVYGNQVHLPISEDRSKYNPLSIYGQSKLSAEWISKSVADQYGVELNTLRLFNVYGPGQGFEQANALIPTLIHKMMHDERPMIDGNGLQTRDFVYVEDVVDIIKKAATADEPRSSTVNVASCSPMSVLDVLHAIRKELNKDITPLYGFSRPGDIYSSIGLNAKAKRLYEWEPTTDFTTGIKKTVDWWKSCE